ncbi:hypothetical protein BKA58DRAFT_389241 [Alternaria rosae]|uniref:uncharacterized protein n=1 Tax=Alternaria rosae TaxID=1187941 RepID=UPI001E8CE2F7|nr:uncharacterized protein BKA58DRAFT_389241 [Alternaria rosae]KAH6867107.1 hypothetical protein BKA58DRAFT_389241 [Alternaria rosae]
MLQDTAVILDNGTALLDLDLDLSENNPINVKVEEFTKEVYAQLEKSRKDREKAIRKFCDLDNWVTGFTQSARDSSNRLRLAIKEDATGREQILTSYMTSLEFWYSKHTAMHKSVRKQINDTSTTLGIDISSKSSTSPTEKTKLLLDGVTKLVRDNDTKANVRLSSLVEVMRSALYVMKATIPSDVTPEAFFSAYHDHANSLVDLLSSETGSIEHSADEVTGALSGKRIIFQDRIAQNTRLHNENLQKLHENYGACIVEMIKSIHSDTLSFQGLVYPEEDVPDLELRPDMSLEAASANAHAAKTWVFACAGTIGTALTGRKVQVEQLALDLAGRINSQRSLLKDYIELKGDLQDSMQLANDLGVQVTRLTGA